MFIIICTFPNTLLKILISNLIYLNLRLDLIKEVINVYIVLYFYCNKFPIYNYKIFLHCKNNFIVLTNMHPLRNS